MSRELTSLKGVVEADVSFDDRRARVSYRPERVTPEELVEAVDRTGFDAALRPDEDEPTTEGRGSAPE